MAPEEIIEMFSAFGPVAVRRMFGGAGIYAGDTMFALVADDQLYFKADAQNRVLFEEHELLPFTYESKGKRVTMSYYSAPEEVFDDEEAMTQWASRAVDAARRGAKVK